jgi:hypothetical protein
MANKKQNPRYNVLSCRVSDDIRRCIDNALGGSSVQDYLHSALTEKLINDRQDRIDTITKRGRTNAD